MWSASVSEGLSRRNGTGTDEVWTRYSRVPPALCPTGLYGASLPTDPGTWRLRELTSCIRVTRYVRVFPNTTATSYSGGFPSIFRSACLVRAYPLVTGMLHSRVFPLDFRALPSRRKSSLISAELGLWAFPFWPGILCCRIFRQSRQRVAFGLLCPSSGWAQLVLPTAEALRAAFPAGNPFDDMTSSQSVSVAAHDDLFSTIDQRFESPLHKAWPLFLGGRGDLLSCRL